MHTEKHLLKEQQSSIIFQLNAQRWIWKKKLELTLVSMSNIQPQLWDWDNSVKNKSKEYHEAWFPTNPMQNGRKKQLKNNTKKKHADPVKLSKTRYLDQANGITQL